MKEYFIDNQIKNYFGDENLLNYIKYNKKGETLCIYCGEKATTREHIPSKVFLEEPFQRELAVLPACRVCNNGFSSDEQYLANLIDYVELKLKGLNNVRRSSIRKTFKKRPVLFDRLEAETIYNEEGQLMYITYNVAKIENVLKKLAVGHVVYSLSGINLKEPSIISYKFLSELTQEEYNAFNSKPILDIAPEIGSRESMNMTFSSSGVSVSAWKIVQEGQYRYLVYSGSGTDYLVRIVIGEYFYAEVIWS